MVDKLSLGTIPLTPYFNEMEMPEATGFVWRRGEHHYLITNWHVVSGIDLFTKTNLHPHGAWPNKLKCHFLIRVGQYERELIDIPIRDGDGQPLWLIHPAQEIRAIDVVALPLDYETLKDRVSLQPINHLASGKLAILIGMDVFILGYPFGSRPPAFPVWKRGSIASEPDLVRLSTGYYLVDTASRPGMSGSPVILRSWNSHIMESNMWMATNDARPIDRVIGVYSGRLRPTDAQIGIVWDIAYVEQIIDGSRRDHQYV